uniref:Uncharacterized protein n=1 Tax=Anguilla anguilla TaxID=7936 RepID=A0A0E9WI41_ANGAN
MLRGAGKGDKSSARTHEHVETVFRCLQCNVIVLFRFLAPICRLSARWIMD